MERPGYIYLVRADLGNEYVKCPYKIGFSKTPTIRNKQLGTHMPFSTSLIHVFRVPDMRTAERELHQKYAKQRLNGEWFHLTQEQIEEIARLAHREDGVCSCWEYHPPCPFFHVCNPPLLK